MGSKLMLSIAEWDHGLCYQSVNGIKCSQIDKSQIPLLYLMCVEAESLIIIGQLLESFWLIPKVIPLSRFHYIVKTVKST
jgi:hypothetical protein